MNDLMTRSFLNYADLKKQAHLDLQSEELCQTLNQEDEQNLSLFFQEVEQIKTQMGEITTQVQNLQNLNEETKTTHSFKLLRRMRDKMDADTVAVSRKVKAIRARIESLEKSNVENRWGSTGFQKGSSVDRVRVTVTNCLKFKFKEMMSGFAAMRDRIVDDQKEELRRRYYNATGEVPTDEIVGKLASGKMEIEMLEPGKNLGAGLENREKEEAMADIKKSLDRLHQVFMDMAVLVDDQGEQIDDIEKNMASVGQYISGGTDSLHYSKQMKKKARRWVYWVLGLVFVVLLVCLVATLSS